MEKSELKMLIPSSLNVIDPDKEFETEIKKNINAPNIPAFNINDNGESVFELKNG